MMVSEGTEYFDLQRLKEEKYRQQVIERLMQDYKDEIYIYCMNMLDSVYGEDIAQEVFVKMPAASIATKPRLGWIRYVSFAVEAGCNQCFFLLTLIPVLQPDPLVCSDFSTTVL